MAVGQSFQHGNQIVHQRQLLFGPLSPTQAERGEQVAEFFAVEDFALDDFPDERIQGRKLQSVFGGYRRNVFFILLRFEKFVAILNFLLKIYYFFLK